VGTPGLFVTGTDTDVGKTVLASVLAATLAGEGRRVAVFKPAVTGLSEQAPGQPPDHEMLRCSAQSAQDPEAVAPYRFGPAVSPHLAATWEGVNIEPQRLLDDCARAARNADVIVVEGVGGLLVPLAGGGYSVRDLAAALGFPVLIAARPGLGTINHTLMTLECARAAGLAVAAVVFTPWPDEPTPVQRSNMETVATLGAVAVHGLSALDTSRPLTAVPGLPAEPWLGDLLVGVVGQVDVEDERRVRRDRTAGA
jgi:dethiobiotin synthetase